MEIVHVYRCYLCGFVIEVRIAQQYTCPCCHQRMGYVTSRPRK